MTTKPQLTASEFLIFSLTKSLKDDKYVYIRPQIMKLAANEQQSATWENVENTLLNLVAHADQLLADQTSHTQHVFSEVVDDDGPLGRSDYGGRKRLLHRRRKGGKWTMKYKRSINCRAPRGFSQRQYCKY